MDNAGKLSSSLCHVLGLTMTDESKAVNCYQRAAFETQCLRGTEGKKMAHTVKRGALLKGLVHIAEVQKHVMKDSARLNSDAQMRAEVVGLLRADAAPNMPMDVDGACLSGAKGKGEMKDKGKGKTDDAKGKGKSKGKGKKGKETRVCHECNKTTYLRSDCFVCKKRMAEKGGDKEKTKTTSEFATVQGAMVETWEYTEDDHVFSFWSSRDRCCLETRDSHLH